MFGFLPDAIIGIKLHKFVQATYALLSPNTGLISFDRTRYASLLGPTNVSGQIGLDDLMKSKQFCSNNYLTLAVLNKLQSWQSPNDRVCYGIPYWEEGEKPGKKTHIQG